MWSNLDSNLKDNLSILTVNAHSITCKSVDLVTNINLVRKRFSFIIVTESWLTYDSILILEIIGFIGYKSYPISIMGRKCEGIKLFYLDYSSTEVISHLSVIEVSYETIFVKASFLCSDNMYVAGIYRPPNKSVTDFTQFITEAMEYTNRFHTVFAGDFNVDIVNNSNVTRNYINMSHQFSFVNEINLPTFNSPNNGSAISSIDHVWHNLNAPRCSFVVSPALSDHYAVCVLF